MDRQTQSIINQYEEVFQKHDPAALAVLIDDDCILENTGPAPDGKRYEGKAACIEFWSNLAKNTELQFDQEGVDILGDRAIVRWRLRWGEAKSQSVRGVNIMRVQDDKIVEALGYVKA